MDMGQFKVGEQNMRPSINTYESESGLHLKMGEQNMGPSINTYGSGLQLKPISPTNSYSK